MIPQAGKLEKTQLLCLPFYSFETAWTSGHVPDPAKSIGGMNAMPLKLKEIANLIGVSPATLSLVVHDKPGIGDATREKVKIKLT